MLRWISTTMGLDVEAQAVVVVDGRTYPSPSLFEDDYGVRTVVFAYTGTPTVPVATWARLFSESPAAVVFTADSRTWRAADIQAWMDGRHENRVTGSYEIAESKLRSFDHLPSYVEIVEALVAPVDDHPGLVHLHAHSEFSALDGYSHVHEMVAEAVRHGQGALALTDHGVCAGHPALQTETKKAGIKPIFGIEAYFVDDRHFQPMRKPVGRTFSDDSEYRKALAEWEEQQKRGRDYWHLVLWAQTDEGLRNIWAMSSEAQRDGFYRKPRMDWDTLERHSTGVMVSTACLRGPLSAALLNEDEQIARQRLGRLMGIFDGRVHMEIHTNRLPEQQVLNGRLVTMAREYGLPIVAVSDSHYPSAEHKFCHKVWIASQTDRDLQDDADLFAGEEDYHILSEAEARDALSYLPGEVVDEAISNTYLVAEKCDASIRTRGSLPVFSKRPTREESIHRDVERLVEICLSNWHKTKGKTHPDGSLIPQEVYEARFEREMKLLISKGFCGYFLMVADYCRHSRANGVLVGPGRGSGGGSLVAYLCNITEIDPVEADLIFERFLTEGRTALPDFDVDFPSSFRDWLTNYIIGFYGEDHVVRVGNHIYMRKKKAVRTLAKVLGSTIDIHYPDIDAICKIIDMGDADSAGLGHSWEEVWAMFPDDYTFWCNKYPLLMQMCEAIVGRLATYGRHAAGVVISPDSPLTGEIPLRYGEDGHAIAEWNMDALDALGLVKFDLLTIRNLDTLQMGVDLDKSLSADQTQSLLAAEGIDFYSWRDEYNDPEVWDEICAGRTLGMFQIETYAGTAMCKRHKPRSMAELADVITLVRPGPARSGLTDTYLRRRHGEEEVSFPHPLLEKTLAKTYGCFAAETRVVTKDGVREIGDLAGGRHELMTTGGGFLESEVRSFGVQPLRRVTLRRNCQEKVIHATPNHRWFAKWHDKSSTFREMLTDDLKPGMSLQPQMPHRSGRTVPSPFGVSAGITFGDGTRSQWQCRVDLHGDKNIQLLRYFSQSRTTTPADQDRYAEPYVRVLDLPRSWKDYPDLDEGPSYLLGWMAGYFAADGCVDEAGQAVLASASRADAEFFRAAGHRCGIGTYGIRTRAEEVPLPDGRVVRREISYVNLVASTLTPEFFLVEQHRERFEAAQSRRKRNDRTQWTVVSIEETDRIEDVFCAVVPHTQAFVLEDNILTGNCILYQEDVMNVCMVLAGYDENQADGVRKILGKKKVEEAKKAGEKFVLACDTQGIDRSVSEPLWAQMEEFAKYSFNRAHAYGYAIIAYWCAWLKVKRPLAFTAAILSTVDADRVPDFIEEARQRGFTPLGPDINASEQRFAVVQDVSRGTSAVRYGITDIKGVGSSAFDALAAARPYISFDDFIERRGTKCNSADIDKLVRIGAFDSLHPNRAELIERWEWMKRKTSDNLCVWRNDSRLGPNGLPCARDWSDVPVELKRDGTPKKTQKGPPKTCTRACWKYEPQADPDFAAVRPFTAEDVRKIEQEMLGVYLSSTPFDDLSPRLLADCQQAHELELASQDSQALVCVQLVSHSTKNDRNGNAMGFFNFLSHDGYKVRAVAFHKTWAKIRHDVYDGRLFFAVLYKSDRGWSVDGLMPA